MSNELRPGDRVRFDTVFLRNTAQFTGPEAPTSFGPFARGRVVGGKALPGVQLVEVEWEDGTRTTVNGLNLERIAR